MDYETARRQVSHELYGKLALFSAVVWTLGTLVLFIVFAANDPRPMAKAAMSMTVPLVPAALPWLLYRPLVSYLVGRRQRLSRRAE
ncbi:MAG TPA: hypothetical protein VEQ11_12205 [Chloroflexota bacterium]|nr:hypothetical protein [Chloroflexota bacterium]